MVVEVAPKKMKKEKKSKKAAEEVVEEKVSKKEKRKRDEDASPSKKKSKVEKIETPKKKEKKSKKEKKTEAEPMEEETPVEKPKKEKKSKKEKKEVETPKKEKEVETPKKEKSSKKEKKSKKKVEEPKEVQEAEEAEEETEKVEEEAKEEQDDAHDDHPTRLFVGGLPFSFSEEDIFNIFRGTCGEVVDSHFITDKASGNFYGKCFLTFESPAAARKAIALSGKEFGGRRILVEAPIEKPKREQFPQREKRDFPKKDLFPGPKPDTVSAVFMGSLPFSVTDDQIHEFFQSAGAVQEIRRVKRRGTDEFSGSAFVSFEDPSSIDAAVKLAGNEISGRRIRLDWA